LIVRLIEREKEREKKKRRERERLIHTFIFEMGPKKSPSRKSKSKEPTPDPEQQNQPSTSGLGDKGGDEGGVKRKDMNAGKTSSKAQGEKGGGKTVEMIQNELAMLEKQAYDEKSKLLNESQFSELLGLQSEDDPAFIEEIIEMYTTDARSMLEELKTQFSAKDEEVNYDDIRGTLHKLKGSSSTFGADGVTEMCDEIRELCIEKNVKDAREGPKSLAELGNRVENLAEFLTKYMEKLRELAAAKQS
jgi:histidine-containing phosphotransfer protein|tara:strand:- start:1393 stop:2133 length:741 start_codon:yes stop_codon:yes gene_type:complete